LKDLLQEANAVADDTMGKGSQDRINIDAKDELEYWSKLLGVSEDELRAVVWRVGNSVEAVALEVDKKKAA
jgi:Protein of unknown function (DUF3606)